MTFEINGTEWEIIIVSEDKMNNEQKNDYTLGLTIYSKQEVWLLEGQSNIIKTLKHELTHVWLFEYGHNAQEKEFNHEDICEIVASSNNFINDVITKFKKEYRV